MAGGDLAAISVTLAFMRPAKKRWALAGTVRLAPIRLRDVSEIRDLEIEIVTGDILAATIDELAAIFGRFDTVIGCAGFSAGRNTPMKLAQAASKADLKRYFPWQFGVDFDVIGRGSPQELFDAQIDVRDLLRAQDKTD